MKQMPDKGGIELIVYQIGELKNAMTLLSANINDFQTKIDKRVTSLEMWQAGEQSKEKTESTILGTFSVARLIQIILAAMLGGVITMLIRSGVIK